MAIRPLNLFCPVFTIGNILTRGKNYSTAKRLNEAIVSERNDDGEVADARMPIFGVLGLLASLAFLVIVGLGTLESHLGLIALIAQVLFLVLYTMYSKPINVRLRQAARSKLVPADIRQLQERWDRVVVIRASLLFIAMACLFLAAVIL